MPFLPWNALHQAVTLMISWSVLLPSLIIVMLIVFVGYLEFSQRRIRRELQAMLAELVAAEREADDRRLDQDIQRGRVSALGFRVLLGGQCGPVSGTAEDTSGLAQCQ